MKWDPWAHPFDQVLVFDGIERPVLVGRLSVAQKANFHVGLARLMGPRGKLPEDATADERDRWTADHTKENASRGDWLNETVAAFLRIVEPWTSGDGLPVASADDLLQAYQDETILTSCVLAIWTCNTLSAEVRKNLPSPSALLRGLAESRAAANGDAPVPIAENAADSASARPVAATGAPA